MKFEGLAHISEYNQKISCLVQSVGLEEKISVTKKTLTASLSPLSMHFHRYFDKPRGYCNSTGTNPLHKDRAVMIYGMKQRFVIIMVKKSREK